MSRRGVRKVVIRVGGSLVRFLCLCLLIGVGYSVGASAAEFPGGSTEEEFAKGFGANTGMNEADRRAVDADKLKIGGKLQLDYLGTTLDNPAQDDVFTNPAMLDLYMDAQMKNDVRAFLRGRMTHDPSVDESKASALSGKFERQTTSSLDEMRISFHTKRRIFWTLGKQKVKWGASKFWNPTDFLNLARRDFLQTEDLRPGVGMAKMHVPWGDSNFYLIGVNERVNQVKNVGSAARMEIPFKFGEWTLSGYQQKGTTPAAYWGTDLSIALWDLDVYVETARTDKNLDQKVSGGAQYEFKYNDEDTVTVGYEAFWQDRGETDKSGYAAMVAGGTFTPFYVSRSYSLVSILLTEPGRWNDTNFFLYAIKNNTDASSYYRLTWIYNGMQDLVWQVALGTRAGDPGTELRYFGQKWDANVQMKVAF